jgi:hypothetical protein
MIPDCFTLGSVNHCLDLPMTKNCLYSFFNIQMNAGS